MSAIVLLDTSVYLNILDVPDHNQQRLAIKKYFRIMIEEETTFLLPMASIWEAGNHIANIRNGDSRYRWASILVADLRRAIQGEVPYTPTVFPDRQVFLEWLEKFPVYAKISTSDRAGGEGMSLSDMSIVMEWERTKTFHPTRRVRIWSLDRDLDGYDHAP